MNTHQNSKIVGVIVPSSAYVDTGAFTTVEVDTIGFDYAQFYIFLGATDIAVTVMNIGHGDTVAGASTGGTIANTNFASTAGILDIEGSTLVLPSATRDDSIYRIDVDLKGKRRYLDLNLTAGNGTTGTQAVAWCVLSSAEQAPITAAAAGCVQVARA